MIRFGRLKGAVTVVGIGALLNTLRGRNGVTELNPKRPKQGLNSSVAHLSLSPALHVNAVAVNRLALAKAHPHVALMEPDRLGRRELEGVEVGDEQTRVIHVTYPLAKDGRVCHATVVVCN